MKGVSPLALAVTLQLLEFRLDFLEALEEMVAQRLPIFLSERDAGKNTREMTYFYYFGRLVAN